MVYWIAFLIGALIGTFLVSRLALLALKRMGYSAGRLAVSHVVSFTAITVIAGYGFADGGEPQFLSAGMTYFVPQLFWLAFDLLRWRRGLPLLWCGKATPS